MAYFSQQEFAAFIAATTGQAKVSWLALSGQVMNEKESTDLKKLLEDFFRGREHRSFRQQGGGR